MAPLPLLIPLLHSAHLFLKTVSILSVCVIDFMAVITAFITFVYFRMFHAFVPKNVRWCHKNDEIYPFAWKIESINLIELIWIYFIPIEISVELIIYRLVFWLFFFISPFISKGFQSLGYYFHVQSLFLLQSTIRM